MKVSWLETINSKQEDCFGEVIATVVIENRAVFVVWVEGGPHEGSFMEVKAIKCVMECR